MFFTDKMFWSDKTFSVLVQFRQNGGKPFEPRSMPPYYFSLGIGVVSCDRISDAIHDGWWALEKDQLAQPSFFFNGDGNPKRSHTYRARDYPTV